MTVSRTKWLVVYTGALVAVYATAIWFLDPAGPRLLYIVIGAVAGFARLAVSQRLRASARRASAGESDRR